jgi:hypothetical protein
MWRGDRNITNISVQMSEVEKCDVVKIPKPRGVLFKANIYLAIQPHPFMTPIIEHFPAPLHVERGSRVFKLKNC